MSGDPVWWHPAAGWQQWSWSIAPNVCCGGGIQQVFTMPVKFPSEPSLLSDADVERIARRAAEIVVDLLRESKP